MSEDGGRMERASAQGCGPGRGDFPLVSIVITSYNRAHFIESALQSALAQDYPNLEVIVSDNCSTDQTGQVIGKYLSDPRVRYSVNPTNVGMHMNFTIATTKLARGEYITYISSDDYLVNRSFVSEAMSRIRENPNIVLVSSINLAELTDSRRFFLDDSYAFYKETFYRRPWVPGIEVFLSFPRCHAISFGGTLLHRGKLIETDPFGTKVLSGDAQVVLKLLLVGDAAFIDRNTYVARRHGGNATATVSKAQTYLDNVDYFEEPYRLARQGNLIERETLEKWREGMYYNFFSKCLRYFYRRDRDEYRVLSQYLKRHHTPTWSRIEGDWEWLLYRLVFASESVGKLYLRVRGELGKLRQALKKEEIKALKPV